jgi:hypothetical protein
LIVFYGFLGYKTGKNQIAQLLMYIMYQTWLVVARKMRQLSRKGKKMGLQKKKKVR